MQERRRGVNPLPVDDNVGKARMFHLAQGVLVGLRRRPPEEVLCETHRRCTVVRTVTICAGPRASGRRRRRDGGRRRRRRRSGHGTSMLGRSAGIDCLRTILIDAPARLKHHVAAHLFPGLRHKSCSCPSSVPCTSSVPRKFRGAAGTTCCAYAPRMRHGMQQRCAAARLGRRAVSSHLCL